MRSRALAVAVLAALPLAACSDSRSPTVQLLEPPSPSFDVVPYDCALQQHQIPETQCEGLVALYNAANGPGWTRRTGWLETATPCSWHGVSCWGSPLLVGELSLINNGLDGLIPAELGDMRGLWSLNLSLNQLTGRIPPELANIGGLGRLNLINNRLTGPIPPELGRLARLERLQLARNQLTGPIPPELGDLAGLYTLNLSFNQLSGPIPPELGRLTKLKYLQLSGNQLTGPIPPELGRLTNLVSFWLEGNGLSGIVPLPVAQQGAKVPSCVFVPPGNEGLYMPDTQPYHDADLDGDGKICGLALTATPETVAAELRSLVAALCDAGALNKGLCNALTVKIDQALKLLAKGKPGEAIEVVRGFIGQVEGITPSHLTPEQAASLTERARVLIELIEMI